MTWAFIIIILVFKPNFDSSFCFDIFVSSFLLFISPAKVNLEAIMSREKFFFLPEDAPPTFARDEKLEKLPLPKLEDTLERYFHNLLPFGTIDELDNSRRVIDTFKNGVGRKLQKLLEERAAKERNWVR